MTSAQEFENAINSAESFLRGRGRPEPLLSIRVFKSQNSANAPASVPVWRYIDIYSVFSQMVDISDGRRPLSISVAVASLDRTTYVFGASLHRGAEREPILIKFGDGSHFELSRLGRLAEFEDSQFEPRDWERACETGEIQNALESLLYYIERSGLSDLPFAEDRPNFDAARSVVEYSVRAERPDKQMLRAAVTWIASRANTFSDEFARASGRSTGNLAPYILAFIGGQHYPELRHWIEHLLSMTSS